MLFPLYWPASVLSNCVGGAEEGGKVEVGGSGYRQSKQRRKRTKKYRVHQISHPNFLFERRKNRPNISRFQVFWVVEQVK